MTKLSPEARDLIEAAHAGERPPRDVRARVRSRVAAAALVGGAATLAAAEATAATAAATGTGVGVKAAASTGLLLKWAALVGVAGSIGLGAGMAYEQTWPTASAAAPVVAISAAPRVAPAAKVASETPAEATASPVAVGPQAAPHPGETSEPAAPTTAPRPAPRPAANVAKAGEPTDDRLEQEAALLARAQAELRAGRAASALEALDDHDAAFKGGVLREERLAQRVLVLCALGRSEEARAEAQRFLALFPRAPTAERVRTSCAGER